MKENHETGKISNWYQPSSLTEVFKVLKHITEAKNTFRFVAGNTSVGIFKDWKHDSYVGLGNINELKKAEVLAS